MVSKETLKTYSDDELLDEIDKAYRAGWSEKQIDEYVAPFIEELDRRGYDAEEDE